MDDQPKMTARKAQVAGGAGFLAPLFIMIPCSATAAFCSAPGVAAGMILAQAGFAKLGLGEMPDAAMLSSALNTVWVSIGASIIAFGVTYFTPNKPKA